MTVVEANVQHDAHAARLHVARLHRLATWFDRRAELEPLEAATLRRMAAGARKLAAELEGDLHRRRSAPRTRQVYASC